MFQVPFSIGALNLFIGFVFIKYLQHWKPKIFTATKRNFPKNWVSWSIRHTSNISKNKIKYFELKYFVREGNLRLISGIGEVLWIMDIKNLLLHQLMITFLDLNS